MEPLAKEKGIPTLEFDPDAPLFTALFGYAGRIGRMLTALADGANPDLAGSLDDLLGGVYALIQAKHHNFTDRAGPINIKPVAQRAKKIEKGRVRTNGQWIAGFYFNNALFRTAAVYHRILKIVVGKQKAYVPELLPDARKRYPRWTCAKLDKVHKQVNDLKHKPRGVHDKRTVTYDDAVAAIGELLDLFEAWTAPNAPTTPKP